MPEMDQQILKKIFESCESVIKELEKKKKIDKIIESFPVIDQDSVSALANTFSRLLAYKVSPDAYQRYSARIQIIEIMREWIQPPLGLNSHPTFKQGDNTAKFILILIKKYLTTEILQNQNTPNNLVKLGKLLVNLSKQNPMYLPHLKIFLERIEPADLSCNETEEFIEDVLNNREDLQLESSLVDKLHIMNVKQSIETPLINNFLINFERLKSKEELLSDTDDFMNMINLISSSSKLFYLASSILKQLFLHCDLHSLVINYIQFVLRNVLAHRNTKNINLDVYPTHLQSYVALLRIDNKYQTESSRKYIIESLRDMYLRNTEQVLILMLHYPNWIEELFNNVRDFI